mmetsp:Transcript_27293/g.78661  ORF Transcript_27293/g.78661 Transcript_27293/m.78661 type:complete len:208 (+) Transcript_27293:2717-3340(+)
MVSQHHWHWSQRGQDLAVLPGARPFLDGHIVDANLFFLSDQYHPCCHQPQDLCSCRLDPNVGAGGGSVCAYDYGPAIVRRRASRCDQLSAHTPNGLLTVHARTVCPLRRWCHFQRPKSIRSVGKHPHQSILACPRSLLFPDLGSCQCCASLSRRHRRLFHHPRRQPNQGGDLYVLGFCFGRRYYRNLCYHIQVHVPPARVDANRRFR